jgi:hypothetical protein
MALIALKDVLQYNSYRKLPGPPFSVLGPGVVCLFVVLSLNISGSVGNDI